jgi:hypothetical protein
MYACTLNGYSQGEDTTTCKDFARSGRLSSMGTNVDGILLDVLIAA